VRRAIDATRHAGDNDIAGLADVLGETSRKPLAGGRGDTGADDADARLSQELRSAARPDQRRRRVDGGEQGREVGLAPGDQARTEPFASFQFALGFID